MNATGNQVAVCALLCGAVFASRAATVNKANNADNLDQPTSWVGGAVPGPGDVAQWTNVVTGANSVLLGGDLSWAGIKLVNPGGLVTIGAGNTLSLGASGIDLASATTNLVVSSSLQLLPGTRQLWTIASGRRLTLDTGAFARGAGATLNMQGLGSVAASAVANDATGIVGPWACLGAGSTTRYITMSAGLFANYSGTVVANASGVTDTTGAANYELASGGTVGADARAHTVRYTGGAATVSGALAADGVMHCGSGTLTIGGPVMIGDSRELVLLLPANQQITVSGALSNNAAGASGLIKGGSGQLRLQGEYAFTGPITVGEGTLQLAPPSTGGTVPGDVFLNGGGYLQYNSGNSQTFSGVISGGGQIHKWNGGQLTLAGSNSFSGAVMIYAGSVRLGHNFGLGAAAGATQMRRFDDSNRGRVELNGFNTSEPFSFEDGGTAGSTLGYGGYLENNSTTNATLTGSISLTKHGTFRGTGATIIRGVVSGPGTFIKDGTGTVNIETNATFTGHVTVSAGTLHVTGSGMLGGGAYAGNISLASGGSFIYNGVATQTLSGVISGAGTLLKWRNEGALVLSGTNLFTGPAQFNAGYVKIASSNALGSTTGATEIRRHDDGNRCALDLNGQAVAEPLKFEDNGVAGASLGHGGFLENGDALAEASCSGAVTLNRHGTFRGAGRLALTGAVSGPGRLIKQGTNTLTISGVNSYTGATVVAAGTLRLGVAGALPAASDVILSNGTLDAGTTVNAGASLTLSGDNTLALGAGASLTFGASGGQAWSGTLALTGTLGPTSLRFPDGLTAEQIRGISYDGRRVYLTLAGYIVDYPPGTAILLQ